MAARYGHDAVVRLLLEKRAYTEAKLIRNGATALHLAANGGYEAIVRLLLEKGGNIEAKIGNRGTALHLATDSGHEAVVRLLLEMGANIEAEIELEETADLTARGRQVTIGRLIFMHRTRIKALMKHRGTALAILSDCKQG